MSSVDEIQLPKGQQLTDAMQPNKQVITDEFPESNYNASDPQANTEEHELETRLK